jgi:hypothetical protein
MPASYVEAADRAQAANAPAWPGMSPSARSAAIFHELCRMDSGCRRTGTEADANLPPCPASDTFVARRSCRLAGR